MRHKFDLLSVVKRYRKLKVTQPNLNFNIKLQWKLMNDQYDVTSVVKR